MVCLRNICINDLHKGDSDDDDDDYDNNNNNNNNNNLEITQTIPMQHIGKARLQGTAENSDIWHYTPTAKSANVELPNKITKHRAPRTHFCYR
jgi:hypothetical protein